ncbi:MAG: hypothetical protein RLZ86_717 [Actinomycetota bacterium]|jgi:hypothetical protein
MSIHQPLRAGVDPLVDPRDVADLAATLMSPRDRLLIFLVDPRLVGSVSVAVDLPHESVADLFALVHEATLGTDLRGLVLAERTPQPLDLTDPIVAEVLDAPRHGLRLDAWVRFDSTSAHDVWPLIGPDAMS